MNETKLKYIFFTASAFLLILMLFLSKNAGISCDEVLHYNHSVSVYNYFATHGKDQSALNTPVTNLKYYGQSYDDITTFLIKWFRIEDVYRFRHLISSFAGWLAVFITGLFAVWLTGYRTGIIVLLLYSVSPTFFGHAQNNLKDVPFALAYLAAIFFLLKFFRKGEKKNSLNLILLILCIAFAISIRAGGLLLLCYAFLFLIIYYFYDYITGKVDFSEYRVKFLYLCGISVVSWFLSIMIWPYALQSPVRNVIESYKIMAHFPSTFRQIFEGKVQWSDQMPWYYLPKSMLITIPIVVLTGLALFIAFFRIKNNHEQGLRYGIIIFTILFPLFFVVYEKSNVYSSWRQFLFLYPCIVLLSATGFNFVYEYFGKKYIRWGLTVLLIILSIHPVSFMIKNPGYYYIYYNQLTGGLKGAYGNYETDYYYVSQTEASAWLINYIKNEEIAGKVKVKATYSVEWQFRNHPEIETSYFRYEERSLSDWDYAIVTNRYISPFKLKNKLWPHPDALHIIYADGVPVCEVIRRKTKDDYLGYNALNEGKNEAAAVYLQNALKIDDSDEMIFYNFAAALYNTGKYMKADSILNKGLEKNPDFEPILMYMGNIARSQNKNEEAIRYYERVIEANRKYFDAYVSAAELLIDKDVERSRALLRRCLDINPRFTNAIFAMADTYRKTNPDIAKKYEELAGKIE
jgi:tetratricopeptide (TPR) repeat protein